MDGIEPVLQAEGLPADMTSLVGRRAEASEVRHLLSSSRLVTLTGTGGVGKTRLALHVARKVQRAFPDGVWLVELGGLADPDLVPLTVMQSVGLHSRHPDDIRALLEHLRERQLLLLLDNAEHLIEACAVLVRRLLSSCPSVRVLGTSREPLRIGGEQVFQVPPLSVPSTDRPLTLAVATRSEAVALFAERAAAAAPGFDVTPENEEVIAALCRRLDGLPLAIELAAVRMRALSPADLLARLDDRYRVLTVGDRSAAPRQQTLRATVEWSHDLCTEYERLLWARLSVFAGGISLEAAEKVCSGRGLGRQHVLDSMTGLVDKSIVIQDSIDGRPRYRMLGTLREYGREQLRRTEDEVPVLRRHRNYYLQLSQQLEGHWFSQDQLRLFAQMRAEHANLRVAVEAFLSDPEGGLEALRLARALFFYWLACGQQREGRYWLDHALERAPATNPDRVAALWANGYLAIAEGNSVLASEMLRSSLELAQEIGDTANLAHATHMLGVAQHNLGDSRLGLRLLEEGADLERRVRQVNPYQILAEVQLGWAYCRNQQADRAVDVLGRCRATCESHGDRWLQSWALTFLGLAQWLRGEIAQAAQSLREALTFKRMLPDVLGVAVTTEVMAWVAMSGNRADRSARLLGACQRMWESLGEYPGGFELRDWGARCIEKVRATLGNTVFDETFQAGRQLTTEQAISYALGEKPPAQQEMASGDQLATLTPRETQIARLVARGLTNRRIANALVIAPRTVDSHVQHILTKLGFTSRTQVATLFVQSDRENAASLSSRSPGQPPP